MLSRRKNFAPTATPALVLTDVVERFLRTLPSASDVDILQHCVQKGLKDADKALYNALDLLYSRGVVDRVHPRETRSRAEGGVDVQEAAHWHHTANRVPYTPKFFTPSRANSATLSHAKRTNRVAAFLNDQKYAKASEIATAVCGNAQNYNLHCVYESIQELTSKGLVERMVARDLESGAPLGVRYRSKKSTVAINPLEAFVPLRPSALARRVLEFLGSHGKATVCEIALHCLGSETLYARQQIYAQLRPLRASGVAVKAKVDAAAIGVAPGQYYALATAPARPTALQVAAERILKRQTP